MSIEATLIAPAQLAALQSSEPVVVIDTRDADTFAAGHIPGAVNLREVFDAFCTFYAPARDLMGLAAEQFEAQGRGAIAVISSVAGDRGRQSNYVYGSAKALVSAFASGLRQRLAKCGVAVVTIKPGFVDTPMTASFKKGALWASPQKVAGDIVQGIDKGRAVVYTPGFWRAIMFVITHIPERIFVKLSL